jgi:hypothetical protein
VVTSYENQRFMRYNFVTLVTTLKNTKSSPKTAQSMILTDKNFICDLIIRKDKSNNLYLQVYYENKFLSPDLNIHKPINVLL